MQIFTAVIVASLTTVPRQNITNRLFNLEANYIYIPIHTYTIPIHDKIKKIIIMKIFKSSKYNFF